MKTARQSASNYYGFALVIEDTTRGPLASGGTQVPVPISAKVYVKSAVATLINGAGCQIVDNGDGTIGVSYRPTPSEIAVSVQTPVQVEFWVKWPDVAGAAVEQWFPVEHITINKNLG